MRTKIEFIIIMLCLTGCSEMRIIGNAAVRELSANAVSLNWNKTAADPAEKSGRGKGVETPAVAEEKSFSSFRKNTINKKTQTKGLWEQGSRTTRTAGLPALVHYY